MKIVVTTNRSFLHEMNPALKGTFIKQNLELFPRNLIKKTCGAQVLIIPNSL